MTNTDNETNQEIRLRYHFVDEHGTLFETMTLGNIIFVRNPEHTIRADPQDNTFREATASELRHLQEHEQAFHLQRLFQEPDRRTKSLFGYAAALIQLHERKRENERRMREQIRKEDYDERERLYEETQHQKRMWRQFR